MEPNPDLHFYVTLLHGRSDRDAPPGEYDQVGGPVFGPFRTAAVEFVTELHVSPAQSGLTVIASTGLVSTPELALAALVAERDEFNPDGRAPRAAACALCDQRPFRSRTDFAAVTLTGPDGTLRLPGGSIFYAGFWWASLMIVPARVFASDASWTEKHEPFDANKATPPT